MILGGIGRSEAERSANLLPGWWRAALLMVMANEVEDLPLTRRQGLLGMGGNVGIAWLVSVGSCIFIQLPKESNAILYASTVYRPG